MLLSSLLAILGLSGCAGLPVVGLAPSATPAPTLTATPRPTLTPAPTRPPTQTPTGTATPSPSPSPTFIPLTPTATLTPLTAEQRERIFAEVWELVRDRYVYRDYRGLDWEAVREEFAPRVAAAEQPEAFYALMHELIDRLGDEHSRFDTPQEVVEDEERFAGDLNYVGIGAIVRDVPEGGLITRLARGGPAEEAGLKPRDLILAIGTTPFSDTEAFGFGGPISVIRGAPGTSVRLTVRSPGGAAREVMVVRRVIPTDAFPSVESQVLSGTRIAVLLIDTFSLDDLDQLVKEEIERLASAGPLDGLIVDVRSNSGGRLDLMLGTLALFVDGGSIGRSEGRRRGFSLDVPRGQTLDALTGVPVVVLTSEDTVSAGEIFAAGMQSLERAVVVGLPSAGNTENLLPHDLPDGSRLWLAELVFYRPDGSTIEGSGVQPDRVVDVEWWRYDIADDPQIQAAVEELRGG